MSRPGRDLTRSFSARRAMPPRSRTDGRADLYSLGVMLNVMITGDHPSRKLADGRLGRVISRCTMTNPKKRYPDVVHLMEAL